MRTSLAILLALLFAVGGTAEARSHRKTSKKKKSHHSEKVSQKKRNMPPGWAWPPSRAMKKVGDACLADLDALGVKWEKGKRTRKIVTPVVVENMVFGGITFKPTFRPPPFTMDCHLALGLERYGQQLYALGVRTVKFSSIYRYDTVTVYGAKRNSLSRHALGLAVDIKSFIDAAGNEAVVLDDYPDGNELLLNIEQLLNDSGGFRTVLTPRNDPESHDDHFHIEVKVDYTTPVERQKPTS